MIFFCSNNELITYYSYNCLVTVMKPLLPHLSSSPCAAMTISSFDYSCCLLILVVLVWVVVAVNGVVIVAPLALLRLLPCRRCRQVPSSCRPSLSSHLMILDPRFLFIVVSICGQDCRCCRWCCRHCCHGHCIIVGGCRSS